MTNLIAMRWTEAQRQCESWETLLKEETDPFVQFSPRLNPAYLDVRKKIIELFDKYDGLYSSESKRYGYEFDSRFGLELYDYFTNTLGMTEAEAANDEYWIYIQVAVVPDIMYSRWPLDEGKFRHSRFWKNTQRLYFKVLWWYIHMVWNGSIESTIKYLAPLDISQVIDRSGKDGTRLEVYREILHVYASVPENRRKDLIGHVLMLNATYCSVIEPELLGCSLNEYVRGLYRELGIDV